MENASKALIIAGSILLSILIIALGMYIFSQSNGAADDTTLSSMETQTFNGKFNKYEGRQNGSNIKALLDAYASNLNGKTQAGEVPNLEFWANGASVATKTIDIDNSDEGIGTEGITQGDVAEAKGTIKYIKNNLESSHVYYVYMDTNNNTDLIHGIIIAYVQNDETHSAGVKRLANPEDNPTEE